MGSSVNLRPLLVRARMPDSCRSCRQDEEDIDVEEGETGRLSRMLMHLAPREVAACPNAGFTGEHLLCEGNR